MTNNEKTKYEHGKSTTIQKLRSSLKEYDTLIYLVDLDRELNELQEK